MAAIKDKDELIHLLWAYRVPESKIVDITGIDADVVHESLEKVNKG